MGKVAMADSTSRMNVGKVQKKGGIAKAGKKKKPGVSFAAERSRRQSTARPKRSVRRCDRNGMMQQSLHL